MKTMPTRIDGELFAAAKSAGEVHRRSAAQQIDYWVRIGRQFEDAGIATHSRIGDVLAGRALYDNLPDEHQAVVRAEWDERIAQALGTLNFEASLQALGEPWAEADDDGNVLIKNADVQQ